MQQHASTYSVLTHTLDHLGGVKDQNIFLKVVFLHIKLKGMEHRVPCKHIFCPYTPSTLGLGQKVKAFVLNLVMLHIKLKGMELTTPSKRIFCP